MSDERYVAIGWVDPNPNRMNRLHLFGCMCSSPLNSEVHRAENLVYRPPHSADPSQEAGA